MGPACMGGQKAGVRLLLYSVSYLRFFLVGWLTCGRMPWTDMYKELYHDLCSISSNATLIALMPRRLVCGRVYGKDDACVGRPSCIRV